MTFKADGKKTNEDEKEKFTQRPSDDDNFSEEDAKKNAEVSEKRRKEYSTYFVIGFTAVFFLFIFLNDAKFVTKENDFYRDETLRKQKAKKESGGPFSEA